MLLEDKFVLEFSNNDKKIKKPRESNLINNKLNIEIYLRFLGFSN